MATFTISISGSAVVNGTKNWTVSDADIQKLADFMIERYSASGQIPLTAPQGLSMWAQSFVNQTISDVQGYQKAKAAIAPMAFT